ncbi:MAG: 1,4-alpha-glucan branching protein GlgB [Clostridiales bacterium]|nr:1,4-alpha-glucan branching protein GlgB [Clostridiales bacterium]
MQKNDELAPYLFHQGTNFNAYEWLGCHIERPEGKYKYTFRVWAPNARQVNLVGDFNGWTDSTPMDRCDDGTWYTEIIANDSYEGNKYKYKIFSRKKTTMKADPYGFFSENLSDTASIIWDINNIEWSDDEWIQKRSVPFDGSSSHFYHAPVNIYEMHLGSWRTRDGQSNIGGHNYLNYREIAHELIPYLKEMNYTHVEFMPLAEHPYDGSWGYQVTGYYSPTSRFGTPQDFAYLINELHRAGIGVIMDWVPAHFPKDEHGLIDFDGTHLYEYQGKDRMEHKGWGTRCFDVGRPEIQSFLVSNALFWMRKYHVDGLRIDAVAAMLYLDFDKKPGEWVPNDEGNNHNKESIAFFKKLNTAVFGEFPYALMVAEESTAWPMLTKPVSMGGLGFNFKWNMGWANDMFEYVKTDPVFRKYHHSKLTFPLMYAFSENYVLPVSHDEVVHCKKSLLDKMFGSYDEKFACMRVFLTYMMTLPGKKLLFMGSEFAPFREWDYTNQLEWFMLQYPNHRMMREFVKDLNGVYVSSKPLYEIDDSWDGFQWIEADQSDWNTLAYLRRDSQGNEYYVVLNFSPEDRKDYYVKVNHSGRYKVIISSNDAKYGGWIKKFNQIRSKSYRENKQWHHGIRFDLPSYGAYIIKLVK